MYPSAPPYNECHEQASPPRYLDPPPPYSPPLLVTPLQPVVVTTATSSVMVIPQPGHRDYMGFSILNVILCCFPIGIFAMLFTWKAREAARGGDALLASSYSKAALQVNIIGLIMGVFGHSEEEKSRRRKDNLTFQWKGCVLLKPPRDPSDIGGKMATGAKYEDAPPPYSEMPPPWTGSQTNGSPACLPQPSGIYLIPVGSHCPTSIFYPPPYSDLPSCAPPYSNVPPTAITGLPLNRDTMDSSCIPESPATCDDHMTRSILSLFLCLPLGIVALIYSFKTRASNKKGDREAAADHSGKSHKLNKICLFGLLVYITLISFAIVKYILHRHHLIGSL